jgi:hypothetical protein
LPRADLHGSGPPIVLNEPFARRGGERVGLRAHAPRCAAGSPSMLNRGPGNRARSLRRGRGRSGTAGAAHAEREQPRDPPQVDALQPGRKEARVRRLFRRRSRRAERLQRFGPRRPSPGAAERRTGPRPRRDRLRDHGRLLARRVPPQGPAVPCSSAAPRSTAARRPSGSTRA